MLHSEISELKKTSRLLSFSKQKFPLHFRISFLISLHLIKQLCYISIKATFCIIIKGVFCVFQILYF